MPKKIEEKYRVSWKTINPARLQGVSFTSAEARDKFIKNTLRRNNNVDRDTILPYEG